MMTPTVTAVPAARSAGQWENAHAHAKKMAAPMREIIQFTFPPLAEEEDDGADISSYLLLG